VVTARIQHFANPREPVANLVGGWFDAPSGRLCLLIQFIRNLTMEPQSITASSPHRSPPAFPG
jgi:hypothetical protein